MIELTNRGLALIILFVVFVGIFALIPKLRRQVGPCLAEVLRAFFVWKIQLPLAIYFGYVFSIIIVAANLGFWELTILKETLIVVCFAGLPMFFSANKVTEGAELVRDVARDVLGVAAFVGAYVGLASLPLWSELLLQSSLLPLIA